MFVLTGSMLEHRTVLTHASVKFTFAVVHWVFVPGSCVAYLLEGTLVACWTLSIPAFDGLRRAFVAIHNFTYLVWFYGDYFGLCVLIVFLDAVHEADVGCFPYGVP